MRSEGDTIWHAYVFGRRNSNVLDLPNKSNVSSHRTAAFIGFIQSIHRLRSLSAASGHCPVTPDRHTAISSLPAAVQPHRGSHPVLAPPVHRITTPARLLIRSATPPECSPHIAALAPVASHSVFPHRPETLSGSGQPPSARSSMR